MEFSNVTEIILLLSAVGLAITNIIQIYIKKPYGLIKTKYEESQKKHRQELETMIKETIPQVMDEELKPILENQTNMMGQMDQFVTNTITLMRQEITSIYYKYKDEKVLPLYVYENLKELYDNYEASGGNHYIHKIYDRMMNWDVSDTDDEE